METESASKIVKTRSTFKRDRSPGDPSPIQMEHIKVESPGSKEYWEESEGVEEEQQVKSNSKVSVQAADDHAIEYIEIEPMLKSYHPRKLNRTSYKNKKRYLTGQDEKNDATSSLPLWQFLVGLLAVPRNASFIQWTGNGLEFKLVDPNEVARRWGLQKNRPAMNYEKLSRAFRYYYEKGIMQKVAGCVYVYKFVCDPQTIINLMNSLRDKFSTEEVEYKKPDFTSLLQAASSSTSPPPRRNKKTKKS